MKKIKLKSKKALLKRIKITGKNKILKRRTHQDHLNAKDSGNRTRSKRKTRTLSSSDRKIIKKLLPNLK